jgi:hypothetical protein
VEFLSEAWVAALSARLAGAGPGSDTPAVVVQQHVTDGPAGDVYYHLELDADGGRAEPGPADRPTVTFTQDWATARALHDGTLTPQEAVLSGRLRVEGTVTDLVPWAAVLAAVDGRPVS